MTDLLPCSVDHLLVSKHCFFGKAALIFSLVPAYIDRQPAEGSHIFLDIHLTLSRKNVCH